MSTALDKTPVCSTAKLQAALADVTLTYEIETSCLTATMLRKLEARVCSLSKFSIAQILLQMLSFCLCSLLGAEGGSRAISGGMCDLIDAMKTITFFRRRCVL